MQRKKRSPRQLMHGHAREGGRGVGGVVGGIIEGKGDRGHFDSGQTEQIWKGFRMANRGQNDQQVILILLVSMSMAQLICCVHSASGPIVPSFHLISLKYKADSTGLNMQLRDDVRRGLHIFF